MPYKDDRLNEIRVFPMAQIGGAQGSGDTPHSSQPGAAAKPGAAAIRKNGGDETPEWQKTFARMK